MSTETIQSSATVDSTKTYGQSSERGVAIEFFKKVPELSLKDLTDGGEASRENFIEDLYVGLKRFGFIVLKDHPIDADLLDRAYALQEQLFSLPEETKRAYAIEDGSGQRGYTPFGQEHAKNSSYPDLKEFWHIGREASEFPKNLWPEELSEFKPVFTEIYKRLDEVGRLILGALTGPLEVSPDYFDTRTDRGDSILRLLHYPPIPAGVDPNCVRAAPHEDINLITLLVSASASGLEIKPPKGPGADLVEWLPIECDPGSIIVDSGDMLARLTNDVIPATTHRVVNPKGANTSRYSMPFFMHPNSDVLLSCLESCRHQGAKYPDITAGEFLSERLREIGLKKK